MDGASCTSTFLAREVQGKFQDDLRLRLEELQNFIVCRHQADITLLVHTCGDDGQRGAEYRCESVGSLPGMLHLPEKTDEGAAPVAKPTTPQSSGTTVEAARRARMEGSAADSDQADMHSSKGVVIQQGGQRSSTTEEDNKPTLGNNSTRNQSMCSESDDILDDMQGPPVKSVKSSPSFKKGEKPVRELSFAGSDTFQVKRSSGPGSRKETLLSIGSFTTRLDPADAMRDSHNKPNSLSQKMAMAHQQAGLIVHMNTAGSQPGTKSNASSNFSSFKGSSASKSPSVTRGDDVELLPVWNVKIERNNVSGHSYQSAFSRTSAFQIGALESADSYEDGETKYKCDDYFYWLVMQPNSLKRIINDVFALIFVCFDSIMIPLQLFLIAETTMVTLIFWMARIFWTLDSMAMFFAGYISPTGDVETRPAKTARHYLHTWFMADAFWLLLDWGEVAILAFVSDGERALEIVRYLRYGRYLRIARVFKLTEMVKHWGERFRSEKVILLVNLSKNFTGVLGAAHFVACLWYAVGRAGRSSGTNWVAWTGSDEFFELYTLSLHWSMAQFAGSDFELLPQNNAERTFSIVIVLFCFVISACFVSSITSYLTRLHILTSTGSYQLATLRRYLEDKKISRQLNVRVQRNAQHALREKQRNTPECEVELLRLISEPLLIELHYEEYVPMLRWHAFFHLYEEKNPGSMRRLCHTGVSFKKLYKGDVIFSLGEIPVIPVMYFVMSGLLEYEQDPRRKAKLQRERWISEPTLWVHWTHCGILRASSESRLMALNAEAFQSITSQFRVSWFHPVYYAHEYFDHLQEAELNNESSDLDPPGLCIALTQKAYRPPEPVDDDRRSTMVGIRRLSALMMTKESSLKSNAPRPGSSKLQSPSSFVRRVSTMLGIAAPAASTKSGSVHSPQKKLTANGTRPSSRPPMQSVVPEDEPLPASRPEAESTSSWADSAQTPASRSVLEPPTHGNVEQASTQLLDLS